jgi:hypothetical protein
MRRELNLKEKHQAVQSLWTAVNDGGSALEHVPHIVKTVLITEAWRERQDGDRVYKHDSFRAFIEADPRSGCGWPLDKVEKLIKDDAEALTLYRKAVTAPEGGDKRSEAYITNNNIISDRAQQGTSKAYTLERLSRESPGLYEAVCRGEMSANRAAIEAGFRKPPKPFDQIRKLLPKLTDAERRQLKDLL